MKAGARAGRARMQEAVEAAPDRRHQQLQAGCASKPYACHQPVLTCACVRPTHLGKVSQ